MPASPPALPQSHVADETSSTQDTYDFDFCIKPGEASGDEHSTADVLFSDGKILPIPIHHTNHGNSSAPIRTWVPPQPPSSLLQPANGRRGTLRDIIAVPHDDEEDTEKPVVYAKAPSFWWFGRSRSQKVGGNHKGGGGGSSRLFSSLQVLHRSKSTGSNLIPTYHRQTSVTTRGNSCSINSFHKPMNSSSGLFSSSSLSSSISSSASGSSYYYGSSSCRENSGVRISPVLNFPPLYILPKRSGNGLLCLGHLLCNGRGRNSRKKHMSCHRHTS